MLTKAERYDILIEALQHLRTIEIERDSNERDEKVIVEAQKALRTLWEVVRKGTDNNKFTITIGEGAFVNPDPDHTRTWDLRVEAKLVARSGDHREYHL